MNEMCGNELMQNIRLSDLIQKQLLITCCASLLVLPFSSEAFFSKVQGVDSARIKKWPYQ
jgi:hypothetical protein